MNRATCNAGFSLVEILVGMVIGLLGVIIIMQIFALAEGQKRTTTSGSDAQTNGNTALYTIERDTRQAGYGMSLISLGCVINTSYNGSTTSVLEPAPFTAGTMILSPVIITDGGLDGSGNALPDQLRLFYSTSDITGMPELLNTIHSQSNVNASIASNLTLAANDMVVFYEAGKNCALAQVTSVTGNNTDFTHNPSTPWNTNNTAVFPAAGYNPNATVYNFGSMVHRNYSIDLANNNLVVCDAPNLNPASPPCPIMPSLPVPIASDIVNLQAVYGKDTNADGLVDTWDNCTPGTGGVCPANTPANWAQILAVRIAILARSGQYEKPTTGGVCTATTAAQAPTPSWPGAAPFAVPGGYPSCYRYKVFETLVPLRNILWG